MLIEVSDVIAIAALVVSGYAVLKTKKNETLTREVSLLQHQQDAVRSIHTDAGAVVAAAKPLIHTKYGEALGRERRRVREKTAGKLLKRYVVADGLLIEAFNLNRHVLEDAFADKLDALLPKTWPAAQKLVDGEHSKDTREDLAQELFESVVDMFTRAKKMQELCGEELTRLGRRRKRLAQR